MSYVQRDNIKTLFMLTGKLYLFSQFLDLSPLFRKDNINFFLGNSARAFRVEYLFCFARTAINANLQSIYFKLFDTLFEESEYLWGYGRILKWYFDYATSSHVIDHRTHMIKILSCLLDQQNYNPNFVQNAFLSLIYMLTFRQNDSGFCVAGTQEMALAEKVIEKYQDRAIILKQVSSQKALNTIYQEMIEGNASRNDIDNLLQAG